MPVLLILLMLVPGGAAPALGAAPSPSPTAGNGDTRTSGQGPGLVGEPFLALVGVLVIGLATVGATTLLVRIGRRD